MGAVVNFRLCETTTALEVIVVTSLNVKKSNYHSNSRLQSLIHKTNMMKSLIMQFFRPFPHSYSQILPSAPCSHITKTIFSLPPCEPPSFAPFLAHMAGDTAFLLCQILCYDTGGACHSLEGHIASNSGLKFKPSNIRSGRKDRHITVISTIASDSNNTNKNAVVLWPIWRYVK